jgi:hypothetical protein
MAKAMASVSLAAALLALIIVLPAIRRGIGFLRSAAWSAAA